MRTKDLNRLGHFVLQHNAVLTANLCRNASGSEFDSFSKKQKNSIYKKTLEGFKTSNINTAAIMAAATDSELLFTEEDITSMSIKDVADMLNVELIYNDSSEEGIELHEADDKEVPEELSKLMKKLKAILGDSIVDIKAFKLQKQNKDK